MSDKPKIYANCPAGCLWETIHKEDFEKSAAYIPQAKNSDGKFYLSAGKTYRINTLNNAVEIMGSWAFNIYITIGWRVNGTAYSEKKTVTLPDFDRYAQSVKFHFHEVYNTIMGVAKPFISWEYDLNGERKIETIVADETATGLSATIQIETMASSQIECLLINEDAQTKATDGTDGKSAFIRYSSNADGTDFTEQWSAGQNYIGIATALTAPTDKSGYTWCRIADMVNVVQGLGNSETDAVSQKAVTDKFDEYDKEFYRQTYSYGQPALMHIDTGGTLKFNDNKNVSFEEPVYAKKGSTITVDEGYKFQIALYDAETLAFIERITWMQYGTIYTLDDDYYVRAEISDINESVLSDASIFEHLKYVLYKSIESTIENVEKYAEETQSASMDNASAIVDALGIDFFKGKTFTITRPIKYNAWSFVGHTNGKLVCVYAKGNTHADVDTGTIYAKTSYNGVVWSTEKMVINTPNIRNTITGKGIDSNGDMLVWSRKGFPASSPSTSFHLYRTSDGNEFQHVSSPVFTTYPAHIGDIINVPNAGLMAFFNTYALDTWAYGVVKSTDNGLTWTQTVIESGLAKSECPTEISGVYVGDGKIFAIGRKEDVGDFDYAMFQIQSNDNGLTWTKHRTNITDCVLSTPSLIYDGGTGELTLYYYQRGVGALRTRRNTLSSVWNNPTLWGDSTIIANGSTETNNAGNVNAVAFNDIHIVTYYSGNSDNTGIYGVIK